MCADINITPLSHCALASNRVQIVAKHDGKLISHAQFHSDVKAYSAELSKQNTDHFAIYYEQAYPFCVSLFALLHSDKKVWIAGNNKQTTAKQLTQQGCLLIGEWQGEEITVTPSSNNTVELTPLQSKEQLVTIFTSGSCGHPKAILKSLQQFQREIETLEQCWGLQLGDAQVLSTVSQQHIYGLLFRVLWPLTTGRCFHSDMYLNPEPLVKNSKNISACWIASPAQLKRLDHLSPWPELENLTAIFSSGGALSAETALQILQHCKHKVLEVYGSSETGGIAWRKNVDNALWQMFDGISLSVDKDNISHLSSPYLADMNSVILDDKIQMFDGGQFALLGRVDRIVKIEEKRLSLDSVENSLNRSDWVHQSHTFLLADKRDKMTATLVLTDSGNKLLEQKGRGALIKQLRTELMDEFETVVLPRKWLFISSLPLTAHGKINQGLLTQLFSFKKTHFPQILSCTHLPEAIELQCRIQPNLVYFSGHFPEQPILPGVTQLAWAEHFGKLFFDIKKPFLRMEVIKFKKVIRPNELIKMQLSWKTETDKLYFEFTSTNASHSSGRIVFGEQQ